VFSVAGVASTFSIATSNGTGVAIVRASNATAIIQPAKMAAGIPIKLPALMTSLIRLAKAYMTMFLSRSFFTSKERRGAPGSL
jgi:hypothetical protein